MVLRAELVVPLTAFSTKHHSGFVPVLMEIGIAEARRDPQVRPGQAERWGEGTGSGQDSMNKARHLGSLL